MFMPFVGELLKSTPNKGEYWGWSEFLENTLPNSHTEGKGLPVRAESFREE